MEVTLNEETQRLVEQVLATGQFSTPREVVEAALTLFEQTQAQAAKATSRHVAD